MNIDWVSVSIGSIASFIISYYFFIRSNKNKELLIVHTSDLLQFINHPDITLLYKNESVESVTVTNILIINIGNSAIREEDINYNLNIKSISKAMLLSSRIVSRSKNIIAKEEISENNLLVEFNYLNKNNYILLEIIHEGMFSDEDEFVAETDHIVDGNIPVVYKYDQSSNQLGNARDELIVTIVVILLAVVMPIGLPNMLYEEYSEGNISTIFDIFIALLNISFTIFIVFYAWKASKKIKNHILTLKVFIKIPKNVLKLYKESFVYNSILKTKKKNAEHS